MAINWPSYSQGTNIGQLYTSSNGDVWRWNGYGWNVSNLQSSGSYGGPWIIFDNAQSPNYYSTLVLALAAAVSGDTIYLATDATETLATSTLLKDGVNINLNGCVYNITAISPWSGSRYILQSNNITYKFQNGKVIIDTDGLNSYGFYSIGLQSYVDLTGLEVTVNGSGGGYFFGSLTGGSFYNSNTSADSYGVILVSDASTDQANPRIFRNIKGESVGGRGIFVVANFS